MIGNEFRNFVKGWLNIFLIVLIILFLPFPGQKYALDHVVLRVLICAGVCLFFALCVYFLNRNRSEESNDLTREPDTTLLTKEDCSDLFMFIPLKSLIAVFVYFFFIFALIHQDLPLESMVKNSARIAGCILIIGLVAGIGYRVYHDLIRKKKRIR